MAYDFSTFKKKAKETEEWLKGELSILRTGRATPALVENIKVDYYGSKTALKAVSAISVEDARTLRIKPWDSDSIMAIEQAVRASELGIQPVIDKDTIRIIFPELTQERRKTLLKVLGDKLEQSKISLRSEREDVWRDIQDKEKEGKISEDEKYRHKEDLQKLVDETSKRLEEIAARKEGEIKI